MGYKHFIKIVGYLLLAIGLNLASLAVLPSLAMAAGAQGVTCVNSKMTEKKYVAIEYVSSSDKFCRTIYNNGVSPTKEIAWGRNGIAKCAEVAGKLVAKLSRAGMKCNHNESIKVPLKTSKHIAQSSKEDDALLRSIDK